VKFCECTKLNILDYPCFFIIRASSPFISPDNQEFTVVEYNFLTSLANAKPRDVIQKWRIAKVVCNVICNCC
jgi:hypothetical protein